MQGRTLLVLMWKHLSVRIRRFIHTPIELISPIIFIVIVFTLKDKIKAARPSLARAGQPLAPQIRNTDVLPLAGLTELKRILYTPDTARANELMAEVAAQFDMKRSPVRRAVADREANKRGYYSFTNSSEITDFVKDIYSYGEAIVIFDGLEKDTWPEKLSYTIRQRKPFFTDSFMPIDGRRPHSEFGGVYHEFMKLQWAIDTSYIKLLTEGDILQNATYLREFPAVARTNDDAMAMLADILYVCCFLSLFLVFVFLMARLLEERSSGIQELIRMVGVSTNLFGLSHFLNVLPAGLVYSVVTTVLLKVTSEPLIPNSDGCLIFITLLLHFVSIISMAFACSYLAKSTQYAVSLSVFSYILLWLPLSLTKEYPVRGVVLLTGLLPHAPVMWFWREVAALEQYGEGLTFGDITTSHSTGSGPVLLGLLCMVLQALLMFALAWYLSLVRPGNYGQALPWNFLCQKQYWTKNEVKPESEMDEEAPITKESKYFEEPPHDMEAGIKIDNVSKIFPKHKALSNVSFDVYKGEITVLLGHNGAGKTTLMSIITGMMSASEGRVLVNGLDTRSSGDAVRGHLGLCPQHNLFFPDLTVLEHVMFFTLLKGGSYKEARAKSIELLDKLSLKQKANDPSSALSGGMKRRLQLACALAGDARVLVLDEPTSGLDVETRRELWDLLLSLRGDRTVLLTTHFMEEADALGDRVAALHLGRLRCHATTMHLKKAIGTGYRLNFTTNGPPRDAAITAAVVSRVPDATLREKTINSLSYNLPASASSKFPRLFSSLEGKRQELGIETIGVGVSTLEEVFLKLCSDTDHAYSEDEVDTTRSEPTYNKVTGPVLLGRQFIVLMKRQFKYVMYRKISFLVLQVIIPIIMICAFTKTFNSDRSETDSTQKLALNMDLYTPMLARKILIDVKTSDVSMRSLNDLYPKVDFVTADNVTEVVLDASKNDATQYNNYVAGLEIRDNNSTAYYTTTVRHAAPVALNLLTNALATRYIPRADGRTFNAHVHPFQSTDAAYDDELVQPKNMELGFMYCVLIVFVFLSTNINSVSLPCRERTAGSRHIHIMSGCPASLHWAVTCLFHTMVCCVFLVTTIAIAAAALDSDHTIDRPDFILCMMLILVLSALAFFALMYIVSMYFGERSASIVLIAILVIFGLITTTLKTIKSVLDTEDTVTFTGLVLSLASYTMPPHAAIVGAGKAVYGARLNAYCDLNRDRCPYLLVPEPGFDTLKCCQGGKPQCVLCIDKYSPGKELITLACQFVVYMTLVIFTQRGAFNSFYDRIFNGRYRNSSKSREQNSDDIVRAEAVYVNKQIALPKEQIAESNHAMLASDLHKNYFRIFGKSCNAVRGINFSVKKGECFGLLGVNGAGKSTTFKMLTAEECTTKGQIYANGYYIKERQPYLHSLGYCPQFFGLDDFQTGRENLTLLLTLRGLDAADVAQEVKAWITIVGLEKYSDRIVAGYSGGCARRLAAAAALACGAPVTLLDEPTAGVDVSARRRVWSALKKGLRQGRAVIITSHSMDEMEALCSRIAIMAGGVVRAVGTPSELRAHHAAGHAVIIKVNPRQQGDVVDSPKSDLERLKSSLQNKFDCTLKDEHKTMLHYHINETLRYSNLFSALEDLKKAFPNLVEDYSVTETTLEEVFLSFAREQREGTPPASRHNHIV